jgi:hypothetical protein
MFFKSQPPKFFGAMLDMQFWMKFWEKKPKDYESAQEKVRRRKYVEERA